MITVHKNEHIPAAAGCAVSVGNFDGVHMGHQALISALTERAKLKSAKSVVITFEPHTKTVLNPDSPLHLLTTCQEKEILLKNLGIDYLVCIPFTRELALLEPSAFVNDILIKRFNAEEWVMGDNHAFGRRREGTKDFLLKYSGRKHITIFPVALNLQQTAVISSTRIRSRIMDGRIREAVAMLGHPYLIQAKRISGIQKGTTLGFPTLNFKLPPSNKVIPPPGVYTAELEFENSRWTGALYIGNCPTFAGRDYHLEFHALSGNKSYPENGQTSSLWIHSFVRKDEIFSSTDELTDRIRKDIIQIQEFFNKE